MPANGFGARSTAIPQRPLIPRWLIGPLETFGMHHSRTEMQTNQPAIDHALNLRRREMIRPVDRHRQGLRLRIERDAMTLESLVRVLQEPRAAAKDHVAALTDFIRAIVREELGGAQ